MLQHPSRIHVGYSYFMPNMVSRGNVVKANGWAGSGATNKCVNVYVHPCAGQWCNGERGTHVAPMVSLCAWVVLSARDGERRECTVAAGVDAGEARAHGGKRPRKADVVLDAEGQGPGHLTAVGIGVAEFDSGFEVFDVGRVESDPPQEYQCALCCTAAIDLIEVEVGTVDGFDRAVRKHEIPAGGEGKAVVHRELVGAVHRVGERGLKRPSRCVAGFKTVAENFLAANRVGYGHGCGEKYEGPKDRTSWFSRERFFMQQEGCHVHNCTVVSLRVPMGAKRWVPRTRLLI